MDGGDDDSDADRYNDDDDVVMKPVEPNNDHHCNIPYDYDCRRCEFSDDVKRNRLVLPKTW